MIWALNVVGPLVGLLAFVNLTPLTFSLAALAPFVAVGLRAWRPSVFILGDSLYRPARFNTPTWRPLSSIVLVWSAPGGLLLFRGLATPPLESTAPAMLSGALVAVALATTILVSEWRVRNPTAGLGVLLWCLFMGWGYATTANLAFDTSPVVILRAVVTDREVIGDYDGNGPIGRGTPTLYLASTNEQSVQLKMPVSRSTYALSEVGSQVCATTRQGALGWRTGQIVQCPD